MKKTRTEPSHIAFRALADPTRREILQLLRQGALNSGDIADRFEATWPTVSRHLAMLRDAGLVMSVRQGQEIRYELNTSVLHDVARHLMDLVEPRTRVGNSNVRPRRGRPRPQEA